MKTNISDKQHTILSVLVDYLNLVGHEGYTDRMDLVSYAVGYWGMVDSDILWVINYLMRQGEIKA